AKHLITALESIAPGLWEQLTNQELKKQGYVDYTTGWRINLSAMNVAAPNVNYLVILIDKNFPNSQIRVVAPQLGCNFICPHTEQKGFLCLRPTLTTADIKKRVKQHFQDAIELLNYSEQKIIQEFNREFIAYWSQRSTRYRRELSVLSLVHPFYNKEDLFYFYISNIRSYVFAESKDQLSCWLRNIGLKISYEQIDESTLWVL